MKKFLLLSLLISSGLSLSAQFCVTLYYGDDFGLPDDYTNIRVMEVDAYDHIWFGMVMNEGEFGGYAVGKFDGFSWTHINDNALFPDPRITAIAFDRSDSVWIGTQNGLTVIHRSSYEGRRLTTVNSGLPHDYVTAVQVDSANQVWAGFNDGSVAVFDRNAWTVYKEWSNKPVSTLAIGTDSTVYAGMSGSPGIVSFKDGSWTSYDNLENIHEITVDEFGRVLIASADSLIIQSMTGISISKTPGGQLIRDVEVKPGGGIWVSTVEGLMFRVNQNFRLLSASNSAVPSQLTVPIAFDSESRLWFAYRYQGASYALGGTGLLYREVVPALEDLVSSDKPGLAFCFGDSLTLTAAADQNTYVWPDGSNQQDYVLYDSATVPVAVEGDNKCYYYDTVRVNVQKVYEEEKICAITVGDSSNLNLIVWEGTSDVGTASYNIYKQKEDTSFRFLANVPVDALSVFRDEEEDTLRQALRYKITAVDTCGNESDKSSYHQTLFLQTSEGTNRGDINLDWSPYEGLPIAQYIIYRGTSPGQLDSLTSIAANLPTKWTDVGTTDTFYYRVGIKIPGMCLPRRSTYKETTGPYTHALSNLDDNKMLQETAVRQVGADELRAWPNPMTHRSTIRFDNPAQQSWHLKVYQLSGRLVHERRGIRGSECDLYREDLDPGYYLFELSGPKIYRGKIIVR